MPRRLWVVLAVALAVLLLSVVRPILSPPPSNPRITKANFDRINSARGLRREDLLAILGPPGDYRTRPSTLPDPHAPICYLFKDRENLVWESDEIEILVQVGFEGDVGWSGFRLLEPRPVGPFELLYWRWNRWWNRD
jgi:hypothetical protein